MDSALDMSTLSSLQKVSYQKCCNCCITANLKQSQDSVQFNLLVVYSVVAVPAFPTRDVTN